MGVPYSHIDVNVGATNKALNYIRELHRLEWESEDNIPYQESIYKVIDDVVEYQLDKMADMELEDFYRVHMQKHYEDKRNSIELTNEYMKYKGING